MRISDASISRLIGRNDSAMEKYVSTDPNQLVHTTQSAEAGLLADETVADLNLSTSATPAAEVLGNYEELFRLTAGKTGLEEKNTGGFYPRVTIEEARGSHEVRFGGRQAIQPSLVPLLRLEIHGVALAS